MKRTYVNTRRAWYAESAMEGQPYVEELILQGHDLEGNPQGELAIHWYRLDVVGEPQAKIEVFADAWRLLAEWPDVSLRLYQLGEYPRPHEVEGMLRKLGFTDATEVVRPHA